MKRLDAPICESLGKVAIISAGYPFRGKIDALPSGDIAVIQMRNAEPEAGIDWEGLSHVELPRESAKALLRPGDIIVSTRGGRHFPYYIEELAEPAVCSPHFFVIRINSGKILPRFLAWQMMQKPAQDYFAAGATGSYILNLKRDVVENLPIVIPPLTEQQYVAEFDAAVRAERMTLTQLINNRAVEMTAIAQQLLAPTHQFEDQKAS